MASGEFSAFIFLIIDIRSLIILFVVIYKLIYYCVDVLYILLLLLETQWDVSSVQGSGGAVLILRSK